MADFTVTITMVYSITARNEEQAEERGDRLASSLTPVLPKNATWVGDLTETDVIVEKDE